MDNPAGSLVAEFPRERTGLLPALQAVQEIEGWLSSEALAAVAEHFRLPVSEASAIATDYEVFRLVKPGSHLVRVCTGLSCRLTGGADHLRTLENRLGIARGQTTSDDRLTLEEADCLSMCSLAPVLEVDGTCHGRVASAAGERLPTPPTSPRSILSAGRLESASLIFVLEPRPGPANGPSSDFWSRAARAARPSGLGRWSRRFAC